MPRIPGASSITPVYHSGWLPPAAGTRVYTFRMTANRDELIHLIEGLPDDQVDVVLADVRRLTTKRSVGEWPPKFFAIGESKDGRTDNARRVDEILAEGFGACRS
ncbi:hypothetical protein GCM10009788_00170 [Nocardioides humi]|uniref:Uncharacterized protein n=2 Tax=Nocardioides humi TaxID=449461 RepID=A0ABN1ZNP8_9ACTN